MVLVKMNDMSCSEDVVYFCICHRGVGLRWCLQRVAFTIIMYLPGLHFLCCHVNSAGFCLLCYLIERLVWPNSWRSRYRGWRLVGAAWPEGPCRNHWDNGAQLLNDDVLLLFVLFLLVAAAGHGLRSIVVVMTARSILFWR